MVAKFIVRLDRGERVDYWLGEGGGTTSNRKEAYAYTVRKLRYHPCKSSITDKEDITLIPVTPATEEQVLAANCEIKFIVRDLQGGWVYWLPAGMGRTGSIRQAHRFTQQELDQTNYRYVENCVELIKVQVKKGEKDV